ncbi:MAG: glutaredoxin domain-containing protein [Acidimicrobiales bacterium]
MDPRPHVPVTVYWRPGCPYCMRLRLGLRLARVRTVEVNIWERPDGAAAVRAAAGGNETVPTVRVGTSLLVNPSTRKVLAELRRH